jgi:hypothetical protein
MICPVVGAIALGLFGPAHLVIILAEKFFRMGLAGVAGKGRVAAQVAQVPVFPENPHWCGVDDGLQQAPGAGQRGRHVEQGGMNGSPFIPSWRTDIGCRGAMAHRVDMLQHLLQRPLDAASDDDRNRQKGQQCNQHRQPENPSAGRRNGLVNLQTQIRHTTGRLLVQAAHRFQYRRLGCMAAGDGIMEAVAGDIQLEDFPPIGDGQTNCPPGDSRNLGTRCGERLQPQVEIVDERYVGIAVLRICRSQYSPFGNVLANLEHGFPKACDQIHDLIEVIG